MPSEEDQKKLIDESWQTDPGARAPTAREIIEKEQAIYEYEQRLKRERALQHRGSGGNAAPGNTLSNIGRTPYGDADEFDRDVDPNPSHAKKWVGHYDDNSDAVNVPVGGRNYRMTRTQALIRGILIRGDVISPHRSPPPEAAPSATTHVLHQGSPLCRFTPRNPVDWPAGHEWVSMEHFLNVPEGYMSGVTCQACGEVAAKIRRKE